MNESEMPKGVEHNAIARYQEVLDTVKESVMPKGVEHKKKTVLVETSKQGE